MNVSSILDTVKASGIGLFVVDGKLRVEAPVGKLTPELRGKIASHKVEIIQELTAKPPHPAPRMAADVATLLAVDSESLFMALWRRTANRLSRVMAPGYLAWAQCHAPELLARREAAREAWDTPEAYGAFKACKVSWAEYRRRVYAWVRAELACIRRHRDSISSVRE